MIDKGILSNDKPAICRMWSSTRCQAQAGTPRRNTSLAFRLERLQKFRYGVPPFQKVPVWRSAAFRLSLSTVRKGEFWSATGTVQSVTSPAPLAPVIMFWVRFRVGLALGLGLLLGLWLGCRWSKRHYHQHRCAGGLLE